MDLGNPDRRRVSINMRIRIFLSSNGRNWYSTLLIDTKRRQSVIVFVCKFYLWFVEFMTYRIINREFTFTFYLFVLYSFHPTMNYVGFNYFFPQNSSILWLRLCLSSNTLSLLSLLSDLSPYYFFLNQFLSFVSASLTPSSVSQFFYPRYLNLSVFLLKYFLC